MILNQTATSKDGTAIAFWRGGTGPPLLLVHGTSENRQCWELMQPQLEAQFTTYALNRRGREGSPFLGEYQLEREFEDVAAVIDAIGERVHVVGHSSGALCALGAATLTHRVRSLVLYEPPMPAPVHRKGAQLLRDLLQKASAEEAALAFFRAGPGGSDEDLERLKRSPVWPSLAAQGRSIPAELDAIGSYTFTTSRFSSIEVPVLFLVGERTGALLPALQKHLLPSCKMRAFTCFPGSSTWPTSSRQSYSCQSSQDSSRVPSWFLLRKISQPELDLDPPCLKITQEFHSKYDPISIS